jgi:hypothetical protein
MSFDACSSASSGADIAFDPALDHMNFRELEAGVRFGATGHALPLTVTDETGRDIAEEFFAVRDGQLMLTRSAMPAMLTRDTRIVRQDCLCYLMERLPADLAEGLKKL